MAALVDHDLNTLQALLRQWECKPSHAGKILRHFYENSGKLDLPSLDVGKELRTRLNSLAQRRSNIQSTHRSADGTTKLLVEFSGGGSTETVLMPGHRRDRAAGCVSSQIGCAMGCDFCASTKSGLERNLEAGEIVEQFLHLRETTANDHRRLTSLVFMGMGEPMHNLDNVIAAIPRIANPDLGGLGWRQVTVSTVGVVPGIDRLADADLNVHLALSLHAPDDQTRAKLIPANRRYPVAEIVSAAKRFYARTRRVVTIEYCLLADVNDSDAHALSLAGLLEGFRAHVNVIPYNPIGAGVSGIHYQRPAPERIERFLSILRDNNTVAHPRQTRGDDVAAACGQLRRRELNVLS
jgi:23S rRNA (adenine2503-C2)-methyltransferase